MIIDNPAGNYRFVRGAGPFSSASAANPGYEIVRVTLNPPAPLAQGYDLIERHLGRLRRPLSVLCATELRIPAPLSRAGFGEFNQPYLQKLQSWKLLVEGANPVARSNVALEANPVAEPMLYAFSYTVAAGAPGATFVVAGAVETGSNAEGGPEVVGGADVSPAGMRRRVEFVIALMDQRLSEIGVGWREVTAVQIYTVHDIAPLMADTMLPGLKEAARHGVRWYYARPPVAGLEFEMDVRGVRQELVVTP